MINITVSKGLTLDVNAVELLATALRNDILNVSDLEGFVVVNDPTTHQQVCPVFSKPYSALNPMVFDVAGNPVISDRSIDGIVDLRGSTFEDSVEFLQASPYSHVLGYVKIRK